MMMENNMKRSKRRFAYSINLGQHNGVVLAYSRDVAKRILVDTYGGDNAISLYNWEDSWMNRKKSDNVIEFR